MKAAFDNQAHLRSRANEKSQEKIEIDALWKRYQAQEKVDLSGEEYERLKLYEPCLWWCKVITILRHYQCSEDHLVLFLRRQRDDDREEFSDTKKGMRRVGRR